MLNKIIFKHNKDPAKTKQIIGEIISKILIKLYSKQVCAN